ncbi:hypothetical protein Smp_155390 [Schistosoma mansoni]|uniref:hypothetical protein n=1 Tax=Schistosoma mansoni TaxID=6183 RepID=UPI0001A6396F|nr:hypothetical protein Smp_155390 [Schistosoma mansoni]|eukprot:XP_018654781.1 hypothetical protein Smp_155390 [Schistosoma mansoni]
METDRNELISMMESSDTDSSTPSLPQKPNDFLIDIGTAAYTNSIALENWHNCLKNSTGELVSHVAITYLDALSKWPNNIGHQSKVCERKCLPNSFLSMTTSHLKNFKHYCIPKTAELLLDYIFSSCPDAKLLATMNSLLKGWINSVSSNANDLKLFEKTYSPNVISSHGSDKNNLQNISLPPLTTPLRDTNNLHKKVYGHSLSKAFTPDDNSSNHQTDSVKSSNERNLPTTSYTQHSDHGAYCLSNRTPSDPISSIQHHWPIMESYNLALACQLVLLFLPPVMYSRLKIMVGLLRRVLSNHERLALWLVNHDSRDNIENKSENILPSDTLSSLEITLHVSDLDPKRLAALGNTAHLIKLLNQILNDREMNPRRKMKCLQDFRKSHPDVFWLRFGNEEKASNYLSRLQRRIDSQTQPSVFERITNALRRRLQSPVKQQD